jgi:uncharacterized surface anchored protein
MKATWIVLMSLVVVGGAFAPQQAPPRDAPAGAAAQGRGSIAGRVMTDDAAAQPLRRVTVSVQDQSNGVEARFAVTDDEGHYKLAGLPKGSYLVTAAKAAYLTSTFGSPVTRLGSLSKTTRIPLADDQHITDVDLRLARGAVLTGIVRNPAGEGVRGVFVTVSALLRTPTTAERTLGLLPFTAQTDGTGRYRLFGLPPADYVVMARYTHGDTATELTTGADVQRVAANQASGGTVTTTGGVPASTFERRPTYIYTPVYYPGTPDPSRATVVSLAAAEERAGVDFQIGMIRTSTVEGMASGADGRPAAGQQLRLLIAKGGNVEIADIVRTEADGRFRFAGVPPGRYSIILTTDSSPTAPGFGQWLRAEITVPEGRDVQVNVRMQIGVSVSGRVTPEAQDGASPPDLSGVRVWLTPERDSQYSKNSTSRADGQFTFAGVEPGRYRVIAQLTGSMAALKTWVVTSAVLGGSEALDQFVDIQTDITDARVTVTDRVSEVAGLILDSGGRPAPEYFIVAFPADRTLWMWGSRRIAQTRAARDGKFTLSNLPPGEYLIGAVTDVEGYQWFEPAFLDQLAGTSAKFSLGPGEKKTQNLTIK